MSKETMKNVNEKIVTQDPPRFTLGTRVRYLARGPLGSKYHSDELHNEVGWYDAVVVKLWHSIDTASAAAQDGTIVKSWYPYKVVRDDGSQISIRCDCDSSIRFLLSGDDWNRIVIRELSRTISDGQTKSIRFDGTCIGSNGKSLSYVLNDELASLLQTALCQSKGVKDIVLERDGIVENHCLGGEGITSLARGIAGIPGLERISFHNFRKTDKRILDCVLRKVAGKIVSSVKYLRFQDSTLPSPTVLEDVTSGPFLGISFHSCTEITEIQKVALENGLKRNVSLRYVSFTQVCSQELIQTWIRSLSGHPLLEEIEIGYPEEPVSNELREILDGFFAAQSRLVQPPLKKLIWAQDSSHAGFDVLAECLTRHDFLTVLDLREHELNDAGAARIQCLLESTKRMEELLLPADEWSCLLEDSGYTAIANGIRRNRSLKTLSLYVDGSQGSTALTTVMSALEDENSQIQTLILRSDHDFGASLNRASVLRDHLVRVPRMKNIHLSGCFHPLDKEIFRMVWDGVEEHLQVETFHWSNDSTKDMVEEVELLTRVNRRLNQHCSRLTRFAEKVPPGLWAPALASVSPKARGIYFLLRSYPAMLESTTAP